MILAPQEHRAAAQHRLGRTDTSVPSKVDSHVRPGNGLSACISTRSTRIETKAAKHMLQFLWDLVIWLVQMMGMWVLAGIGAFAIFLRTSFSRIALGRSLVTAVVVFGLVLRYGFATEGLSVVDSVIGKYLALGCVAAAVLAVLSAVYVLVGRPPARGVRFRRLFVVQHAGSRIPGPLSTMAFLALTIGFVAWVMTDSQETGNSLVDVLSLCIVILPALTLLLLVPFSVAGTVFNAGNAHPALQPLAAPFIAAAAVFLDGVIATPENLKDPLAIAGLVVVVVLSGIELYVLQGKGHGLTRDLADHDGGDADSAAPGRP
ncbi:hypothetical protein [Kitasatospora purpeofusca]|uniref:hypothetical protein n=1 Tax=Kitasatospora purpeofusca TaxID=67352 RepID=UPI0036CAC064